ncbi:PREDICTED: 29 kDa ribonucleoprotein A, chloroplastic [Ipomoea nil]|uniref:29 kDa ribonucleoprotein A, chloroplastic n=1 Tax=Ipomoea nil TaxID=35883 RepID=UPI000901E1AB|nr:PREDICTED: 29 kDa ribonucleoprotein A, chloroplastic [Ipomoea nil]
MAAIEGAFSIVSSSYPSSTSPKFQSFSKPLRLQISPNYPTLSLKSLMRSLPSLASTKLKTSHILRCSTVEEQAVVAVETEQEKTPKPNLRRKLFVLNLPWSLAVSDVKELFGQCGTVEDVEFIKTKEGQNRGFAFVTMASGEEAEAAIQKFNSYELSGRTIRVEYSKKFKKPIRSPPPPPPRDGRYKLYVSNLAWKARSTHLRELFSANFNPISARVVFENASGKSAGYGFVAFGTKEEAEAAISSIDGTELLGRPIRLKMSEKNDDPEEEETADEQPEES